MIPRRIKLKGFLCYKDEQQIDFDGNTSLWMLSGLNGSGKSAIFDALTFALFGYHRGGGQQALELVNKDCDGLVVEFEFFLDNQSYKIKRTVKRRANNTSAGTQQIFFLEAGAEKWQAIAGTENKRDGFDPWISQHVGLDYETFTASVLLLQGKAERLLDSRPEGRRSVLAKIVDLERYERLFRVADEKRKTLEAELKTLTNHLETLPAVQLLQMEEVRRRIAVAEEARAQSRQEVERLQGLEFEARAWVQLQGRLQRAGNRLDEARRLLGDAPAIEKDLARLEELREVLPRLQIIVVQVGAVNHARAQIQTQTVHRDSFSKQFKVLDSQVQQTRDRRVRCQHVIEIEEKKQQEVLTRYRETTAQMETLKEFERQQGELKRLQAELSRLPSDPLVKVQAARTELEELNQVAQTVPVLVRFGARRDELRVALRRNSACKHRLTELQTQGKRSSDDLDQVKTRLETTSRELQQANERAAEARTLVQQARDSLQELATLDGSSKVCRACGQPITPGHIEEERRRRSVVLKDGEMRLQPVLAQQKRAHDADQKCRAEIEQVQRALQEAREDYRACLEENKQAGAEVERLQKECALAYGEVSENFRSLIGPGAGLDWAALSYPSDADLQGLRGRAHGVAAARQLLEKAEQMLRQWQDYKTLESSTAQTLTRLRVELPGDPQEVRRRHTGLGLEEQTLKKSLDTCRGELKNIEKDLEQYLRQRDQLREQIDQANNKIRDHELAVQHAQEAIASYQKQLPAAWVPLSANAGSRELFDWQKEHDELVQKNTDQRGKELKEARLNVEVLQQERADLEAEQKRVSAEARVDPATVGALLAGARRADQVCEKQVSEAQRELGLLETQQQQREKLQAQFLEKDGERNVQKLLAELLGRDRLQLYLVRQAERQVVDYANAVLDRLSGGQLYLRLSGEAEGEGSTARALELEAYNRDTGAKPINVAFLSGSQKFRVAVSLALGIGQYASRQHRPIESVIIDEGFGCLDRQGRQVMIQELLNLRGHMRCILLVSHQEEFADAFSDGYHFELQNGATQVKRIQR